MSEAIRHDEQPFRLPSQGLNRQRQEQGQRDQDQLLRDGSEREYLVSRAEKTAAPVRTTGGEKSVGRKTR
jgi:hypothetical protein